jgi:hypothetical protein
MKFTQGFKESESVASVPGFVILPKPIPPPATAGWVTIEGFDIHVVRGVWNGADAGWNGWLGREANKKRIRKFSKDCKAC